MIENIAFPRPGQIEVGATGEIRPVTGMPFDFTAASRIGARIDEEDEQLGFGKGYNHNYIQNKPAGALGLAARVHEPASGRVREVLTTEPGLHFYSGNALEGSYLGKGGRACSRRGAFCMEPQHYPDSPNKRSFPSVALRAGELYRKIMIFRFPTR